MQKTVYTCDQCHIIIGAKRHISLSFGAFSGIALPPGDVPKAQSTRQRRAGELDLDINDMPQWMVASSLSGKFFHFCNATCIGRYFSSLMKNA